MWESLVPSQSVCLSVYLSLSSQTVCLSYLYLKDGDDTLPLGTVSVGYNLRSNPSRLSLRGILRLTQENTHYKTSYSRKDP